MGTLVRIFFVQLIVSNILVTPVVAQHRLRDKIQERLELKDSQAVSGAPNSIKVLKVKLAGRDVAVWENPNGDKAISNIVLFSHGFLGCNTQSSRIMEAIANAGFTVFSPNHNDALCQKKEDRHIVHPNFAKPYKWSDESYKDRRDDFVEILKALRADPSWSNRLDFSNVSLVGHSLGGYTVLALAGGWPSWRLPNVKAVLGLSPYALPFINRKLVNNISVPSMFHGGSVDFGITPSTKAKGGLYDQAQSPSFFIEFKRANHFSWTDLNKKDDKLIKEYTVKFLKLYAAGDSSVAITGPVSGVSDYRSK